MTIPVSALIIWTGGIAFMAYCLGWRNGYLRRQTQLESIRELKMVLTAPVEHDVSEVVEA